MLTVCCVNWGKKYHPRYVLILEAMVKRNLSIPHKFVCFTDKPFNYSCETRPLPGLEGWWNKVYLFKKGLFEGKVLFLDLDVVITGNLDELVNYSDEFTSIKDWNYDSYNSSVMILGNHPEIWNDFTPEVAQRLHGDQDWITYKLPFRNYFPETWCQSYRGSATAGVHKDCKIVCFHGEPKPHEAKAPWVKELWRI